MVKPGVRRWVKDTHPHTLTIAHTHKLTHPQTAHPSTHPSPHPALSRFLKNRLQGLGVLLEEKALVLGEGSEVIGNVQGAAE